MSWEGNGSSQSKACENTGAGRAQGGFDRRLSTHVLPRGRRHDYGSRGARYYAGQDNRLAAPLIHEPFTHGELGVLLPKGSEDLLAYVNDFLTREKESGKIDELAENCFLQHAANQHAEDSASSPSKNGHAA